MKNEILKKRGDIRSIKKSERSGKHGRFSR